MQDLSGYISFSDAQKRCEIKHPALSYRIKALKLNPTRQGRKTFLSVSQISLLDDLNKFLLTNPNKSIAEFLSLQKADSYLNPDDLMPDHALKKDELSSDLPDVTTSLTGQCDTNESLTNPNIPQIQSQMNHILKGISRREGCEDFVSQAITNQPLHQQDTEKDKEIAELEEEIEQLEEELKNIKEMCAQWKDYCNYLKGNNQRIKTELIHKINECETLKSFWKHVVPYNVDFHYFIRTREGMYLKINSVDFVHAKDTFLKALPLIYK